MAPHQSRRLSFIWGKIWCKTNLWRMLFFHKEPNYSTLLLGPSEVRILDLFWLGEPGSSCPSSPSGQTSPVAPHYGIFYIEVLKAVHFILSIQWPISDLRVILLIILFQHGFLTCFYIPNLETFGDGPKVGT